VQRALCVDVAAVLSVVGRNLSPLQRDLLFVLVNDPEYGGTGGLVSVSSLDPAAVETSLHEMGHTLGLLADEYTDQPPACTTILEPPEPNVTVQTSRTAIKWNTWIDAATPLPTSGPTTALPGLYLGGKYCPAGVYRPTFNSKMRSLGQPYEQVNTEQLVKRFYNFVAPLDNFSPTASTVAIPFGGAATFQVTTPRLATHDDVVTWLFDGAVVGSGPSISLAAGRVPPGPHTLTAAIRDTTAFVRSDPRGLLQASHSWAVNAGATGGAPNRPTGLSASSFGSSVVLAWLAPQAGGTPTDYVIEAGTAPGLANLTSFATGNPATVFTTTGVGAGQYYVRVRAENALGRSDPSDEVVLSVAGEAAPDAPTNLTAAAVGATVTLTWSRPASGATPTQYVVEAGSAPGLSDLANVATGTAVTTFQATGVAAGRYYLRVRSANAAGRSAPSPEVLLTVGSGCAGAPTLTSTVSGTTVTLVWTATPSATSYQLEAGSTAGATDLVNVDTGGPQASFVATGVASGTYFVRVRGLGACGRTAPSNEVAVTVR
jgi:hypothetical protein